MGHGPTAFGNTNPGLVLWVRPDTHLITFVYAVEISRMYIYLFGNFYSAIS